MEGRGSQQKSQQKSKRSARVSAIWRSLSSLSPEISDLYSKTDLYYKADLSRSDIVGHALDGRCIPHHIILREENELSFGSSYLRRVSHSPGLATIPFPVYQCIARVLQSVIRPIAMGFQKNKNEQISVGRFCGEHAMGAKTPEMFQFFFVGLCFFCGHLRK